MSAIYNLPPLPALPELPKLPTLNTATSDSNKNLLIAAAVVVGIYLVMRGKK